MPGGMVSNISWRFLKFFKSQTSPNPAPRPRNHPESSPMERNLLLQIHNDQLIGITFDASEMMSFALFAASGPSHVLKNGPEASEGWWLPGYLYLVVFLTSNLKGWGGVEKRTFYRLARSEQMSGSELQTKSVPKDENVTIQKKKFQMFFRAKKFMEIQQSLVDSPSTSPSTPPR